MSIEAGEESGTFVVEVLHSRLDLLLQLLRGEDQAVCKRFPVLLQKAFSVNQNLLEPKPLLSQAFIHVLDLQRDGYQ